MAVEHAGDGVRSSTADRRVRIGLLGPVTASVDGHARAVTARRQRAVLAYLALHPGEAVSADRLLDEVWGDDLPDSGARAVAFQISKLRSALEPERTCEGTLIETTSAGYALRIDRDDVDVRRCRRLVDEARSCLADDPGTAERLAAAALALWRGRPLADLGDERFVEGEVHRLDQLRLLARRTTVEARLALGRHVEVIGDLEALVVEDPLEESLVQLLMTAYHRAGRTADALRAYGELRIRLGEELGIEPSGALQAAERELLIGAGTPSPQDLAGRAMSNRCRAPTVPAPLTTFVGRDEELDEITASLASIRLVTLCGFGGLGKTRLAVEIAARHAGPFGEVWFVDLTSVESAEGIAPAFVVAGGVVPSDRDPVDRLLAHLTERRALIVVDNCEHLVDDVAELVTRILVGSPDVRVLATSRVALGVPGEAVRLIGPLPAEADVELFTDRARLVRPGFAVDDANREDVERLCARLDGIPLAIEMAAGRLSMMSVRQVVVHLDDHVDLPARRGRGDDRHASLAAVMEWSYGLLDASDRSLLQRVSRCVGGFDLDAVVSIGTGDVAPPSTVIDRLGHLVELALIVFEDRGGIPRYHMLDTVRRFASEHLDREGPDARRSAARAHAAHYLELAQQLADLETADHAAFLRLGDREIGNLRAAIEWAYTDGDPRVGLRIARGAWGYFAAREIWRAKRYVRAGVELIDEDDVETLEATALSLIDESSDFDLEYLAVARARVEAGLETVEDPELRSTLLRGLAASFVATDPRTAERLQLLAIAERPVAAVTTMAAIHNRCTTAWVSGRIDDDDLLLRPLGELVADAPALASHAIGIEAMIHAAAGRWDDVIRLARDAHGIADLDEFVRFGIDAARIEALLALDRPEDALTVLRGMQAEDDGSCGHPLMIGAALIDAPIHAALGDPRAAIRALDDVVDLIGGDPRRLAIAVPTAWMLGIAAHDLGQRDTAAVLFGFAAAEQARLDIVLRPCDRPRAERARDACRTALGAARFDELAAQGAQLEFRDLPRVEVD